jgi:TolA-binding protein
MSQQQTLSFSAQSRSNSTNPPNLDGTGATPSTKRTRNDEPERETTAPSGGAFDHVISEINDKQNKNFGLMDDGLKRYFKDAIHEITTLIQHQHDSQLSSLQNEIASLKTSVNRLERAHLSNNTQQQPTNKQTTTTNNTTQSTQQDRGRSNARTPNPERQPSQRQPSQRRNRGASTTGRRVTYANTASQLPPVDTPTTPATPPRKKTVAKLITTSYPKADREIIVAFKDPMTVPANEAIQNIANLARITANKALQASGGVPPRPLLTARITSGRNLVFTTSEQIPGSDYTAYLPIIANSLKDLGEATATLNERWTKFLLHNVPTSLTPNEIRYEIETHYPELSLAQTPRWLKRPEDLAGKKASAVVLALLGTVTLEGFGLRRLAIANNDCKVESYHQFANWTQCHKCQQLGHPQDRCKQQHFTCGICALPHATRDHPCHLPTCKQGPACTHPPNKCINCDSTEHKSMDRNCPTRTQAYEAWKNRHTTITNTGSIPPPSTDMDTTTS